MQESGTTLSSKLTMKLTTTGFGLEGSWTAMKGKSFRRCTTGVTIRTIMYIAPTIILYYASGPGRRTSATDNSHILGPIVT